MLAQLSVGLFLLLISTFKDGVLAKTKLHRIYPNEFSVISVHFALSRYTIFVKLTFGERDWPSVEIGGALNSWP